MSSVCISNSVSDTRAPLNATYVNLYNWPESDTEFVKTVGVRGSERQPRPRVVDSVSCRQLYLKSYTFSRKESMPERTKKCLGRVKERVLACRRGEKLSRGDRKYAAIKRVKESSFAAMIALFQKLLSCTAAVDVADSRD